jgi:GT2 family glycosyltransferase/glycosyltransferase involved in cell wall biosynthesis
LSAVKLLFASGSEPVIAQTLREFAKIFPEIPLVIVSEFPPPAESGAEWIRYHIRRHFRENYEQVRSRLGSREIRVAAIILEPNTPHWPMRLLGMAVSPWRLLAFTENGQHFRLRPDSAPVILRHLLWRGKNFIRSQTREGGWLRRKFELLAHARRRKLWWLYLRTRMHEWLPGAPRALDPWPARQLAAGISVVIPSRNGRDLLAKCLPLLGDADEIIVVDNSSDDGSAEFLRRDYPNVAIEESREPLSFSEAVNRGLRRARYSHVCLLNNDMLVEPGFFTALRRAFDPVPNLFSATAQIFLPEGARREETGKTVWNPGIATTDFPVRCVEPLEGEDSSYVLYGSGGCTLYDAAKLGALGGFDQRYQTAYVEDLDIGVRAWLRGWPSAYCAGARVLHQHRATTSRYFTPEQLDAILESNFARFLAGFPCGIRRENLHRLRMQGKREALLVAAQLPAARDRGPSDFLALVSGDVAVFPGQRSSGRPVVLIASPYLPFPLSHGAAVRMYNLMRRAARDFDLVLVSFVDELAPVPSELKEICVEIVAVRRAGTHAISSTPRPDTVEEFNSPAFHAALRQSVVKWHPRIVQLEFTQMAQYAADCKPARTILVEHDITYDLYAQMLSHQEDWENRRQYERWLRFETQAWREVDCVVTMSEKDRAAVPGSVAVPNGVDLDRFQPSTEEPEPRRLLFIGSFAHPPNVLGLQFFLREVFPRLERVTLHVIAGQRHERFWDLRQDHIEVEGFVADVRPAYHRAAVVIAPLVASAGTNIKILEAMAMGKAIVSTEAGINGLDLNRGSDVVVTNAPEEMAKTIQRLLDSPEERRTLEHQARQTAELRYGWDAIAEEQKRLYGRLQLSREDRVVQAAE